MAKIRCPLCGTEVPEELYTLHEIVDQMAIQKMQADFPGWQPTQGSCLPCLERYRQAKAG
jgi:hypothetical protein